MLGQVFLYALLAELYIFFRYVWKKCQWRTIVLYAVYVSLSVVLMLLMFKMYFNTLQVSVLYKTGLVMGVLLSLFVSKLCFSVVDVWTLFFKSRILKKIAFGLATLGFISCMYGMLFGRFNMTAKYFTVENKDLPQKFDGYKILQISDLHLASLYGNQDVVSKWVDMMNAENPDMICFTGDIESVMADEIVPHLDALKRLKAKDGKFAILGNHDYGGYHKWKSQKEKENNQDRTESLTRAAGFDLLSDEYRIVSKDGDSLAVVGMGNWGRNSRHQYGDLTKAENGLNVNKRILLSHDPDFWDMKLKGNNDYFLTLSGHTHAMQVGLECGEWAVSLSSLRYPYWYGLYERDGSNIVVSRGIGCTVIPIRFGMSPEYVVVTLKK